MSLLDTSVRLANYLDTWKEVNRKQESPVEVIEKIADLLEAESEARQALDPDPFDDRPLARTEPESVISHLLRSLYDNIDFRTKVSGSYIFHGSSDFQLNCAAARVLIILLHAFTDNQIVELFTESNVGKLMSWAKDGKEPLRSYSCALLAPAIQTPDCPGWFKETNSELVPILIKRLYCLSLITDPTTPCVQDFTELQKICVINKETKRKAEKLDAQQKQKSDTPGVSRAPSSTRKRKLQQQQVKQLKNFEYDKPSMKLNPLTVVGQQKLILKYLHPLGEYQEALPIALELNAIDLVFHYIDPKVQTDPDLACAALLYLSSLLCHKKFILEFVSRNGVQKILEIPQPSSVATMSSLCLYYITFNEDAVERICLFPPNILHRLVEYLLWMLECSHISGRCHAALFFSMTFSFKAVLELFDSMDGLRKVVNMISTLKIVRVSESSLTEHEDVFLDREIAKNACLTLKKYFEAHITILCNEYRKTSLHYPSQDVPVYKPMIITPESIGESIECIICNGEDTALQKQLVKKCLTLGLPQLLLQLLSLSSDWVYNAKTEVMTSILDTLLAMSSSRKIALTFCQAITVGVNTVGVNDTQPGIKVLLIAIEGDLVYDIDVQQTALKILCNCVTSKQFMESITDNVTSQRLKTKESSQLVNTYMQKIWSTVRLNNGIMVLLAMLKIRTPIIEADSVRANVCKALCGLSENDLICQILSKLPIFHNDDLQILMREPILSDRLNEHIRFCKYASMLIERVTGKPSKLDYNDTNPMLSRIAKAGIVSQTKIMYPQKELLTVIYNHLQSQGLEKAASALKVEANLPVDDKTVKEAPPSTPYSAREMFFSSSHENCNNNGKHSNSVSSKYSTSNQPTPQTPMTPFQSRKLTAVGTPTFTSPQLDQRNERKLLFTPKRKLLASPALNSSSASSPFTSSPAYHKNKAEEKLKSFRRNRVASPPPTLDKIVKSYLRDQHSKCSNPVVTCPPFSLLRPHHCPEPLYRTYASQNITKRLMSRQMQPRFGGRQGRRHNRNFLYSRFRSVGAFKESKDDDCMFTACAWLPDGSTILGNKSGEIRVMNNYLGEVEIVHQAHESSIANINVSYNTDLMATSAYEGPSCLFTLRFDEEHALKMDLKYEYERDWCLKFNSTQTRLLGTDEYVAHLYDLGAGNRLIAKFDDPNNANNYSKNIACFGPCDDLVLNDGCLWDVRAKKMIHKFDKFNDYVSGVFHPSGLEIIINSEVWDLRTFHLLDTCPALDKCQIVFSNKGDVIYAGGTSKKTRVLAQADFARRIKEKTNCVQHGRKKVPVKYSGLDSLEDVGYSLGPFESSFRTFDSYNYSAIGTVETKKQIYDICPDFTDECLAVIEKGSLEIESTCRLYDIGRTKQLGEQSDDEQDDESDHSSAENNMDSPEDLMDLITNMLSNDGYEDYDDDDDFEDDEDNDIDEDESFVNIDDDDDVTVDDENDVTIDVDNDLNNDYDEVSLLDDIESPLDFDGDINDENTPILTDSEENDVL